MFTLTPETVGHYLPILQYFLPNGNGNIHFYFEKTKDVKDKLGETCNAIESWAHDLTRNIRNGINIYINNTLFTIPDGLENHDDAVTNYFLRCISASEQISTAILSAHHQYLFELFEAIAVPKNTKIASHNFHEIPPLFRCKKTTIHIHDDNGCVTWKLSSTLYKGDMQIGYAFLRLQLDVQKQKWELIDLSVPHGFLGMITTNEGKHIPHNQLEHSVYNVYCQSVALCRTFIAENAVKFIIPTRSAGTVQTIAELGCITQPTFITGQKNRALVLPANHASRIRHYPICGNLLTPGWSNCQAQGELTALLDRLENEPDNIFIVTINPLHFRFLDMAAILYLQNLYPERLFVIKPDNIRPENLTPIQRGFSGELPKEFTGCPVALGTLIYQELSNFPTMIIITTGEVLAVRQMPLLREHATFVDLIDRNESLEEKVKGNPSEKFRITKWHVLSAHTVSFARQARVMPHCCAIDEELSTTTPQITGNTIEELLGSIQAGAIEATQRIQSITRGKESDAPFFTHNSDIIKLFHALQSQIVKINFTSISDLIQYLQQLLNVAPAIPEELNLQNTTIYYYTFLNACMTTCLAAAQTLMPDPEPQPMVAAHQECCCAAVAAAASEKPYQVQKMEMPEPGSYPAERGCRQQITAEEFIGKLGFATGINTAIITVCNGFHIVAIRGCPNVLYSVGNAPAQSREPKVTLACKIQFSERLEFRTIDRLPNLDRNAELPEGLSLEQRNALDEAIKKHNPPTPSRKHHPGHWQSAQLPPQTPGQHHDRHHQASTGRDVSQPHQQDSSSANPFAYRHW